MRRKTLITAGFIIATVLQGISYPAIALADNGANTTEQESVSSSKSEQSYNSPENDNQNDSDTNAPSTSADNATSTTIDNKEDTRSTTDTTVQPKAEDDMDGTPADAPSSTPQNGWNTDKTQWYENGQPVRSKFFYDKGSDAWYWADEDSSIACNKDVFVPASNTDRSHGKWVRFDEQCQMVSICSFQGH